MRDSKDPREGLSSGRTLDIVCGIQSTIRGVQSYIIGRHLECPLTPVLKSKEYLSARRIDLGSSHKDIEDLALHTVSDIGSSKFGDHPVRNLVGGTTAVYYR